MSHGNKHEQEEVIRKTYKIRLTDNKRNSDTDDVSGVVMTYDIRIQTTLRVHPRLQPCRETGSTWTPSGFLPWVRQTPSTGPWVRTVTGSPGLLTRRVVIGYVRPVNGLTQHSPTSTLIRGSPRRHSTSDHSDKTTESVHIKRGV